MMVSPKLISRNLLAWTVAAVCAGLAILAGGQLLPVATTATGLLAADEMMADGEMPADGEMAAGEMATDEMSGEDMAADGEMADDGQSAGDAAESDAPPVQSASDKGPKKPAEKSTPSKTAPKSKISEAQPVRRDGSTGFTTGNSDEVIQFINAQIRQSWADNEVQPSPVADDSEFLRRVYLDVVGHIPPVEEVESFIKDKDPTKRSRLIERLLEDPAYVRNWTTIWTNLCIGQTTPDMVSRPGMQKFFREAFGRNRPWKEVVYDLVTAEGHFEKNGAANFLLAQMADDDDGVQMTAKTTRLFMGMQVQCTQCHNHPFNDWKQDQFWQFNSFFRQTAKIDHQKADPKTGRMVDDYSEVVWKDFEGPVYFEKRSGLMQVAFPIYLGGVEVDPASGTERRKELGRLMTEGDRPQISDAFVNRVWGQFFGFGFTRPIDDMGPHNSPTHPVLLERLSAEFVKSGYDVKQLIRWVANCEAYNLTSRSTAKNEKDNPNAGEAAQFTHLYVKPMSAEQLYDSLIVATNAHKTGRSGWEESEKQRQEWLQQFVRTFGTDEGEESNSFDGTIPQALMMMNGELVTDAVSVKAGSHFAELLNSKGSDTVKIQKLYLAVLGRAPTRTELGGLQKVMRGAREPLSAYQDLFWSLLNSNEFILNH